MKNKEALIRPLSVADARRFLTHVGASDRCFSCGNSDWTFDSGLRKVYRGIPLGMLDEDGKEEDSILIETGGNMAEPMLMMTCNICAFVRLHELTQINRWLNDHPLREGAE